MYSGSVGEDERFAEVLRSPLSDRPPRRRGWGLAIVGLIVVVVGAGVGIAVVSLRGSGEEGPTSTVASGSSGVTSTTGSGASSVVSTTTTAPEPVLLVEDPPIYSAVPGPEPEARPSGMEFFALEPIESVSLDERGLLGNLDHLTNSSNSGGEFPDPTLTAVGEVPGMRYRVFAAKGVNGFSLDPDAGKPGECYYLFGAREQPSQVSLDCFTSPETPSVTPLWSGLESKGVYAWAGLPPEASVAVLQVGGSAEMWERPQSGVVVFSLGPDAGDVSLVVLDVSGAEIARGDRTPRVPPPTGPIPGYGDYSGVSLDEVNWEEAWASVARCVTEHGYDTIGFAEGLMYLEVPGTEDPVDAVAEACLQGMGLPPDIARADQ